MAYTVTQLVSGAYHAAGIVSKELETLSGGQLDEGVQWLNEIIGEKVIEETLIPYESSTTFTGVVGQEEYSISNLIDVDTLTFVKDNVRYSMTKQGRRKYLGRPRTTNIQSLPYSYHFEREFQGGKIFLWFLPDEAYEFTIYGIFRLSTVTLNQDLELTLDSFYISYLRRALTARICQEFNETIPTGIAQNLAKLEALISKKSRKLDLRIHKRSTLGSPKSVNYAWANLGEGWLP